MHKPSIHSDWGNLTEQEFIALYPTTPNAELVAKTGLPMGTITARAFAMGLKKDIWHGFSEAEFRRLFPITDSQELAILMGVGKSTVTSRAQMLGIKKDEEWKSKRRKQNFREHVVDKLVASRHASRKLLPYAEEVVVRYQQGASLEQLGSDYNTTATTVARFLENQGTPRRHPSNTMRRRPRPVPKGSRMGYGYITKQEFVALYPTTHTEDLMLATGLSRSQIKSRAQALNLQKQSGITDKHRKRLRESHLGYNMPKAQREAISLALKASPHVRRGANHPNWRGGTDPEGRNSPEYKIWRAAVLERDDYTCQDCNRRFGKRSRGWLEAHHDKDWATFPESRLDISNGVCLCAHCHTLREGKKPRGPEIKFCDCGCSNTMQAYDSQGRLRHYLRNHSPKYRESRSRLRKGMKFPKEWCDNIAASRRDKKLTNEHREKLSKARKGKPHSNEHSANISKGLKDSPNTRHGPMSDESRERITEGLKKAYAEGRRSPRKSQINPPPYIIIEDWPE